MSAAAQSSWKPPDADRQPSAWSPPESDRTPPQSIGDQLTNQGFLDSAWGAIKGQLSTIKDVFTGEYSRQTAEQIKQFHELEKSGTPEQKREFAKQVVFSNIPFASTIYKAAQGNIAGAAGDIAGMAALPIAAKVIPAAAGAVKTGAGIVSDVARSPVAADVVGVVSPRAANLLRVYRRGANAVESIQEVLKARQGPPAAPPATSNQGPPPPEPIPPSRQLGPGPIITPPPPNPSFVRAVPAEYPFVESPMVRAAQQASDFTPQEQALADHVLQNVEPTTPPAAPAPAVETPVQWTRAEIVDRGGQLPAVSEIQRRFKMGYGAATDVLRAAREQLVTAEPTTQPTPPPTVPPSPTQPPPAWLIKGQELSKPATAPAAAPKPAAAELAQQFEATTRPDRMLDFLKRMDPEISAAGIDNLDPNQWELVARGAGSPAGTIPTPEDIAAVRGSLAQSEGASQITATTTPAEAKAQFEQNREIRTKRKGPAVATEPAPAAAPTAEAPQVPESWQGAQPPPPGPPAPTASEVRVEAFAKHLAQGEIPTDTLAGLPSQPKALLQLEELGRSLGIEGRPAPGEVQQIVDRVRQLRGEGPQAKPAAYQPDIVIHGMSGYDANLWDMVQSGDAPGFGMVQKTYTPELRTDTTSAATRAAYERLLQSRKARLTPERIKAQQKEFDRLLEADKQAFAEGRPPAQEPPAAAPRKRRSK